MFRLILHHIICEYCINVIFHNILNMFSTPVYQFKIGQCYNMLEIFTIDSIGEISEFLFNCTITSINDDTITIEYYNTEEKNVREVSIYNLRIPNKSNENLIAFIHKQ